ncbi:MAG TPA: hypothetical protein PK466_06790 [Thermotogota bacterium]|nr:hypothetical protein [Thermotogota bacterium]
MKKIILIVITVIMLITTTFSSTEILNRLSFFSKTASSNSADIIIFEDDAKIDFSKTFPDFFKQFIILNQYGKILYTTEEKQIPVEILSTKSDYSEFFVLALSERIENTFKLSDLLKNVQTEALKTAIVHGYYNQYPDYSPIRLISEFNEKTVFIDGKIFESQNTLELTNGDHQLGIKTDEAFRQYGFNTKVSERTQCFYLPKAVSARFVFLPEEGFTGNLNGLTLEMLTLNCLPLSSQIIFTEEKIADTPITDNLAVFELNKAIRYDTLTQIKLRIKKDDKELFKKLYPVNYTKSENAIYDSMAFLNKKTTFNIIPGDDSNATLVDTEWAVTLQHLSNLYPEITYKSAEELEDNYYTYDVSANRENTELYINDQIAGTLPLKLWLLKDTEYTLEAECEENYISHRIIPVYSEKEFLFEF